MHCAHYYYYYSTALGQRRWGPLLLLFCVVFFRVRKMIPDVISNLRPSRCPEPNESSLCRSHLDQIKVGITQSILYFIVCRMYHGITYYIGLELKTSKKYTHKNIKWLATKKQKNLSLFFGLHFSLWVGKCSNFDSECKLQR